MVSVCLYVDRTIIQFVYITGAMSHHHHTTIFVFQHYNNIRVVEISKTDELNNQVNKVKRCITSFLSL